LPTHRLERVAFFAVLISLTVILTRAGWIALAAAVPRRFGLRRLAFSPDVSSRELAVIAWASLRGGDTLAAALSVPLVVASGAPFPARAMIQFLAFAVIVVTLVGQGLSLPPLIRRLGVAGDDAEAREEAFARQSAAKAAIARLDELAREDGAPTELLSSLRRRYAHEAKLQKAGGHGEESVSERIESYERFRREVLAAMHTELLRLRDEGAISDGVMRVVERDLDLEAARFDA
jgi:CPA1 family monovalent cation:H+ antiporter